jgi:hypothetical protein
MDYFDFLHRCGFCATSVSLIFVDPGPYSECGFGSSYSTITINVPLVLYGAVQSGFEGGLSITRGILGGGGLKIETFLGP